MRVRANFPIYLITDRKRVDQKQTLLTAIEAALRGGVTAVQLREKDLAAADLVLLARSLRELTRQYHALLLINDRIDVALAVDADGVHLGGHSLSADIARNLLGPEKLVGVSTHHPDEIITAASRGADFVTFGPVYTTPSKAAYGPPQGLEQLRAACAGAPLPVYALGGIKPGNRDDVLAAGANGIALISAIIASPDPEAATLAFCPR